MTYIEGKEDEYTEAKDISADSLMELAESKYRTLVEKDLWKEPTSDEKKIVALTAQIAQLKKQKQRQSKGGQGGGNNRNEKTPTGKGSGSDSGKLGDEKKTPWYWVAPKNGEPNSKKVGDKTYYWCPNHGKGGKWVRHKPKDCKTKKGRKESNNNNNNDNSSGSPSLQVNSMAAEVPEDDF